jgi:glutamyl-tRNA synthetase
LVLSKDEVQKRIDSGLPYVVRFLTPKDTVIHLSDVVRGEIEIDSNTLDDKILFKSDGMPTYHLANVVDDHLMKISHVIRGEEWLPSLALHQLLYTAFGWKAPKFAHLPLILKPSGKGKLSKRDGDKLGFPVFPIAWNSGESYTAGYRESGYFPDAVINFLAFLGWNPGTEKEFFKLNELVENFDLKQVNKAGARFDPEKILWFNHHYLQNKTNTVLAERMIAENEILKSVDPNYVALVIGLIKERANLSSDLWGLCHYFFKAPKTYNEKGLKKAWKAESEGLMSALCTALDRFNEKSSEALKSDFSQWIEEQGVGFGKVMMPLRLALVGALEGADVFDIIHCIGKAETIFRIKTLIDKA